MGMCTVSVHTIMFAVLSFVMHHSLKFFKTLDLEIGTQMHHIEYKMHIRLHFWRENSGTERG